MAPKPKHSLDEKPVERGRPFVGREDLIKIFKETVRSKFSKKQQTEPEPTVLVFHGVAGIGKTELRSQLAEKLEDAKLYAMRAAIDFATVSFRNMDTALFHLRRNLKTDYQMSFPTFDLGHAIHWQKVHPQSALNRETYSRWEEGNIIAELVKSSGEFPGVDIIVRSGKVLHKLYSNLRDWWTERGIPILQMLPQMEPPKIEERLPMFLAEDIRNHMNLTERGAVLFFDTYEAVAGKEREEHAVLAADEWVRELILQLPEALWVITGREKLRWAESSAEWGKHLRHHELLELEEKDVMRYLDDWGIKEKKIRDRIFKGSRGVPLYVVLSVQTYENIPQTQKRKPVPGDFGETFQQIRTSFVRNLRDPEIRTLRVLSSARNWDESLFSLLVKQFDTGLSRMEFDDFHRFGFIRQEPASGRWSMHELMRDHLQADLKEKRGEIYRDTHQFLFEHYNAQLEDVDVKNVTDKHKTALTEAFYHATNFMDADDLFGWVIHAGAVFKEAAQWQILVPIYNHTISILESVYGKEDPRVADCLNNLAFLYDSQGRYKRAEPLYKQAIEIDKKALGEDHPGYATDLSNLAGLYRAQGRYKKAEPLYKKVMKISKKTLGEYHPQYAIYLNNLALLYDSQGRYEEAEPLFKKAIEIDKKALGEDHPGYATDLNNLAGLYFEQERYGEAEPLYKKAIEIGKKTLGEEHPSIAIRLNNLAELYRAQGRYEEAEPLYMQAIEIDKKTLGEDHPDYATDLNNLALLYCERGRYKEAEPLYKRALAILEKSLPPAHPNILTTLDNLAIFYREWGKEAEARKYEKRAEQIRRKLEK